MIYKEIKENILYAGMNDEDRLIFDELIPLDHGTSYNSYIILGSEKTAVIDTMYPKFTKEYLKSFDENRITKVDYIIANHGEQDHSGSIPASVIASCIAFFAPVPFGSEAVRWYASAVSPIPTSSA